jgi:hypothetical protein
VGYIAAVHDDGYFDEPIAATYDEDGEISAPEVVDPVVDFLARLAAGGRALELGIGTGRIALPLARRGVAVHGGGSSSRLSGFRAFCSVRAGGLPLGRLQRP